MRFSRRLQPSAFPGAPSEKDLAGLGIRAVGYQCEDLLEPLDPVTPDKLLLAAWSLEQFPGGDDVTAFALTASPETAINFDFYGLPEREPQYFSDFFLLPLGGSTKFQIGVTFAARPRLLGALDRRRELLILRQTEPQEGVYFNIADNDQPGGPYSAADLYSVFSGGSLGFFELETIGAMRIESGRVGPCPLVSRTWMARGPADVLIRLLRDAWGVTL